MIFDIKDALAWTLIHFLWQGAELGLVAFAVLRGMRPERATTRYAVGVGTLGMMLLTAIATFTLLSNSVPGAEFDSAIAIMTPPSTKTAIPTALLARPERDAFNEIADTRQAHSFSLIVPSLSTGWQSTPLGTSLSPAASSIVVAIWSLGV